MLVSLGTAAVIFPGTFQLDSNSDNLLNLHIPNQLSSLCSDTQCPTSTTVTIIPATTSAQPSSASMAHIESLQCSTDNTAPVPNLAIPVAPGLCILVRGKQGFLLLYARAGANMIMEGCSLSNETSTIPLPNPVPVLGPQVPQRDADHI